MPSAYVIPPWIAEPANPAKFYDSGYQIGVHVGAQQAAQAFKAQQLALEQHKELMREQQQAYEDQMNTQVLNMKAAETARRFQANQEFRARVGAGEDPASVLMQLAPDLGESPTSILHQQALRDQAGETMRFRQLHEQRISRDAVARQEQSAATLEERIRHDKAMENKPAKPVAPKLSVLQQADKSALTSRLRALTVQAGIQAAALEKSQSEEDAKAFHQTFKDIADTRTKLQHIDEQLKAAQPVQPATATAAAQSSAPQKRWFVPGQGFMDQPPSPTGATSAADLSASEESAEEESDTE